MAQSIGTCKYVEGSADGRPFDQLIPCDVTSESFSENGCSRVCLKKLEPFDDGGPIHYFIMDAICIGTFTVEFLCRIAAAPATIGVHRRAA